MLAGRKLLLADDSATIRKVIELTFADEGVRVVAFGDGIAALEHLEEHAPDIVLADVFMPGMTGYEVCQYIKQDEKLKHIPVMLLVGSFEPFDEAEARKVGADDILTKPFQSIRRLIDRVGSLVGGRRVEEEEVATAELPQSEDDSQKTADSDHRRASDDLAFKTADTRPLPPDLKEEIEKEGVPVFAAESSGDQRMETTVPEIHDEPQVDADSLLDLGEFESVNASDSDDFVLELDADEAWTESDNKAYASIPTPRVVVEPAIVQIEEDQSEPEQSVYEETQISYHRAEEKHALVSDEPVYSKLEPTAPLSVPQQSTTGEISAGSLSPEVIDAIARRAVEMLSEKVVREIAWDVVPELAELLIRRQLEEKESQHQ